MPRIEGEWGARFERVREAFAENFEERGDVGAAVAVFIDGRPVVDLWGGHADKARPRPWERDTIVNVYSATKGIAATCVHRLVERGKIDLDAPVARYWPEFAQAGKERLPVRYIFCHRAGLPAGRKTLPPNALVEGGTMTTALAAETPWGEPGPKHGCHALTLRYPLGEPLRRARGESIRRSPNTRTGPTRCSTGCRRAMASAFASRSPRRRMARILTRSAIPVPAVRSDLPTLSRKSDSPTR